MRQSTNLHNGEGLKKCEQREFEHRPIGFIELTWDTEQWQENVRSISIVAIFMKTATITVMSLLKEYVTF